MSTKLILAAATFSVVAFAAPKSYNVVLAKPMQAGSAQLAPGEYKVMVEGSNAVFTPAHSHNAITIPAKVETESRKFDSNVLDSIADGNTLRLKSIALGGSKTKLEFGN
jgi:hypothetical protein